MRRLFILGLVWLTPGSPSMAAAPGGGGTTVDIEGDSACPSAADVRSRVSVLLADDTTATATTTAPARARVDRTGAELRVRLADERGVPIAERLLPATGSCPELAEVVAVTIGTWLAQLRPERLDVPRLARQARPSAVPPVAWDLGAGVQAALAEGGLAAGASALLSVHTGARGPGLLARAAGTTARQVSVGAHSASWRRWDVTIGPSYQLPLGAWRLTTSVGFSAGWLSAQGRDFPQNQTSTRFSPGLAGQIQLGHPFGAWSPWLSLGASAAIYNDPLTVGGSAAQRALRPIELQLGLGAAIRWLP
ncbi:MAG TPA: hypothetical protein VNO55_29985 [Polyangia bacterium]|nr:hypothetical protein [Polyangia bacterium]